MSFCNDLRTLRKRLKISQAQAAEIIGVTPAAVGHYERGIRTPPTEPTITQGDIMSRLLSWEKQQREK